MAKLSRKCPVKGGKVGEVDKYNSCDTCVIWEKCDNIWTLKEEEDNIKGKIKRLRIYLAKTKKELAKARA